MGAQGPRRGPRRRTSPAGAGLLTEAFQCCRPPGLVGGGRRGLWSSWCQRTPADCSVKLPRCTVAKGCLGGRRLQPPAPRASLLRKGLLGASVLCLCSPSERRQNLPDTPPRGQAQVWREEPRARQASPGEGSPPTGQGATPHVGSSELRNLLTSSYTYRTRSNTTDTSEGGLGPHSETTHVNPQHGEWQWLC